MTENKKYFLKIYIVDYLSLDDFLKISKLMKKLNYNVTSDKDNAFIYTKKRSEE